MIRRSRSGSTNSNLADVMTAYCAAKDGWPKCDDAGQRRMRLRGTPEPVQDDPRIEAAHHGAGDWQLLLQLDLADLAQNPIGDGTLFFLISNDKLAARDFSDVRAIYDQT